ncbi:MAG: reprolysin-like metallopeptidase [Ferruginibacter sp.]
MRSATMKFGCFIIFFLLVTGASAQNSFFRDASESGFNKTGQKRAIIPLKYRTLNLNPTALLNLLKVVPSEKAIISRNSAPAISIPMPGGDFARFNIWESSVMDPRLAAKYPGIKTYTGQGIDDPTATIKLDWTPLGFHAMILSSITGSVFIDPYTQGNATDYISYFKHDFIKRGNYIEHPVITAALSANRPTAAANILAGQCLGSQLRTYRLALAGNGEYTAHFGGTVAAGLAAEVVTMNRVNGIYEREVAIRMVIIANNYKLIFTNGNTDPYTNDNLNNEMLDENQHTIDSAIGNANYDIGHVFSTGGGGVAWQGVVCVTGYKARGVTGTSNPTGDAFDVDYVAHEIGHQFGASHTFDSQTNACNGNGSPTTNAEPGSGSTIMGYAGICGSDDLQPHSDPQFHAMSLNEITDYTINDFGNNCAVITTTGNTPPVVNAGANYVIPKSTPFVLSGSATDANGDALTFSWEQIDVGGPFDNWNSPSGDAPLFRSFVPQSTPVRYFPRLADVVANSTTIGEIKPTYARTMHFRLTARDNRAGGGGVCFAETAITVSGTTGPFVVTAPNTGGLTWLVNDFKTVTWNIAGTAGAPINCSNVRIELSTDGGLTYPVTILASTPNDGSQEISVPNNITTQGRIRVVGVGNVFYDISNFNFAIQNSAADFVFNNPQPVAICGANSAVVNINSAALNGFSTAINLSATGNPAGTTVSFGTNPLTPGSATTVTLNNTTLLAAGTYNITVNGLAGSVNKSRIISIVVNGVPTTSFTSNLTGAVYQWQVDTGSGFTNITNNANYTGANTATLQVTNAPTVWTTYQYRCVVDGVNSKLFTLGYTNTWTGAVSSAWENTANWSCGEIPNAYTDAIINSGAAVVNSNGICRSLKINPGATVTVNTGFQLTVVH